MIKNTVKYTLHLRRLTAYHVANDKNTQTYKPLMPLTQKHNLIYLNPSYGLDTIKRNHANLFFYAPAALMFINNLLTTWTYLQSAAFIFLMLGGSIMQRLNNSDKSLRVYAVQIDPNIQQLYVTVRKSAITKKLKDKFGMSQDEQIKLLMDFHPILSNKVISNQIRNGTYETKMSFIRQFYQQPFYKEVQQLERKTIRLKFPLSSIKPKLVPKSQQKLPEFQRDLERLSPRQVIKKYEDCLILIPFSSQLGQAMHLMIYPSNNINRKYHDYLIGLGLGFRIETSTNAAKDA